MIERFVLRHRRRLNPKLYPLQCLRQQTIAGHETHVPYANSQRKSENQVSHAKAKNIKICVSRKDAKNAKKVKTPVSHAKTQRTQRSPKPRDGLAFGQCTAQEKTSNPNFLTQSRKERKGKHNSQVFFGRWPMQFVSFSGIRRFRKGNMPFTQFLASLAALRENNLF